MSADWISSFSLKGDPFGTRYLETGSEFQSLFVKTQEIISTIDPMADKFVESEPRVFVIGGERGVGKSTTLHYLGERLSKEKTVLQSFMLDTPDLTGLRDPIHGIGTNALYQIIRGLVKSLSSQFPGIVDEHMGTLSRVAKDVGYDIENQVEVPYGESTYGTLRVRLQNLCDVLRYKKVRSLIGVDNYDKLGSDLAIDFLRSNYAQGIFELLLRAGASIVLIAGSDWFQKIQGDRLLNYLGTPLTLRPLNYDECKELILKRILSKQVEPDLETVRKMLSREALQRIAIEKNGLPRDVLDLTRRCMIKAWQKGAKTVDVSIVDIVLQEERGMFSDVYSIINSYKATKDGYQKLLSYRDSCPEFADFKNDINTLRLVFKSESPVEDLERLRQMGIVRKDPLSVTPGSGHWVIDPMVEALLKQMQKAKKLEEFVDWLTESPKGAIVSVLPPEEREHREYIKEKFESLQGAVRIQLISDLLRHSSNAFEALRSALDEEGDVSTSQLYGKVSDILRNAVYAAIVLHRVVDQKLKASSLALNDNQIVDFVDSKGIELEYVRLAQLLATCTQVGKGRPYNEDEPHVVFAEVENLLIPILKYCETKVAEASTQQKEAFVRISSAEELGKWIAPRVKSDPSRYFVVRLQGVPPNEYLLVGWTHKNKLYANLYGEPSVAKGPEADTLLWPEGTNKLPDGAKTAVQAYTLNYLNGLKFYNPFELASYFWSLANERKVIAEFVSPESSSLLQLESDKEGHRWAHDNLLPTTYGQACREVEVVAAHRPRSIKMEPGKPYQNIRNLEELFSGFHGSVSILDIHFDEKSIDVLPTLYPQSVKQLRVLMGQDHLSGHFKLKAKMWVEQLKTRNIEAIFRVLQPEDREQIHDRYLMDDNEAYNIPPLNIIHNKLGDVKLLDDRAKTFEIFEKFWKRSRKMDNVPVQVPQVASEQKEPTKEALTVQATEAGMENRTMEQLELKVVALERELKNAKAYRNNFPAERFRGMLRTKLGEVGQAKRIAERLIKDLEHRLTNPLGMYSPDVLAQFSQSLERAKSYAARIQAVDDALLKMK